MSFIEEIFLKDTRTFGAIWRRFMFGSRSVPPAISIAFGPSPARMRAASATVCGARCSNQGRRIIFLKKKLFFPERKGEVSQNP